MIAPVHLAKNTAQKPEKPMVTGLDAAQWQQAMIDATAAAMPVSAKPAPAKHVVLPAQKPEADQPAPIEMPAAAKKTAPVAALGQAPAHKKTDTPPAASATASLAAPPAVPLPATPSITATGGRTAKPDDHAIAIDPPIATANVTPAAAAPATAPSAPSNPQPSTPNQIRSAETALPAHEESPGSIKAALPPAIAEAAPSAQPAEIPAEKPAINAFTATPPAALTATAPTVNPQAAIQATASPAPITAAPITANAAGLAAAITAMHQSGQSSATMRLDPPGLGSLTIHLGIGQNDAVNVLFVTAVPQTSQIIANHLNDLRQAMENSGLSLGNTSVGSGNGGNAGTNPQSQSQPELGDAPTAARAANPSGIRAYA